MPAAISPSPPHSRSRRRGRPSCSPRARTRSTASACRRASTWSSCRGCARSQTSNTRVVACGSAAPGSSTSATRFCRRPWSRSGHRCSSSTSTPWARAASSRRRSRRSAERAGAPCWGSATSSTTRSRYARSGGRPTSRRRSWSTTTASSCTAIRRCSIRPRSTGCRRLSHRARASPATSATRRRSTR